VGVVKSQPVRVAVAVGCVLVSVVSAGCSSDPSGTSPTGTSTVAPPPATRAVKDPSIPGIGATRDDWDASHVQNPAFNNGAVYGYDPSLPSYLSSNSAVYIVVIADSDMGTTIPTTGNRIQVCILNMQPVDRDEALARVRQELPSDATVAWDLTLDKCYRVAFNSATLEAAAHRMAV
jgi:hypothetical protein